MDKEKKIKCLYFLLITNPIILSLFFQYIYDGLFWAHKSLYFLVVVNTSIVLLISIYRTLKKPDNSKKELNEEK